MCKKNKFFNTIPRVLNRIQTQLTLHIYSTEQLKCYIRTAWQLKRSAQLERTGWCLGTEFNHRGSRFQCIPHGMGSLCPSSDEKSYLQDALQISHFHSQTLYSHFYVSSELFVPDDTCITHLHFVSFLCILAIVGNFMAAGFPGTLLSGGNGKASSIFFLRFVSI